jgi:hypothetical protein
MGEGSPGWLVDSEAAEDVQRRGVPMAAIAFGGPASTLASPAAVGQGGGRGGEEDPSTQREDARGAVVQHR